MTQHSALSNLEMTFGRIPPLIKENAKYLSYNESNDDFTCTPCYKIIQKSSYSTENTTLNFEKHLSSNGHKTKTITTEELLVNLNSTFNGSVPPLVLMTSHVLGIYGENYECSICEETIQINERNMSGTENNLSDHLVSYGHEEKLKGYNEVLSQLFQIYGGVPRVVLNHCRFLVKNGIHYTCTICEKQLQVHPTDIDETEKCFEKHLHSLKHIRNAKQEKAFSLIPELKQIFSGLPHYMLRNSEYINVNGSNFFCSLCNENIKFNKTNLYETELNFKLHFSSYSHEEKLSNRKNSDSDVLNILWNIFDEIPNVVEDNIKYLTIYDENFYCEICEETIIQDNDSDLTWENLEYHFQSPDHDSMVSSENATCTETLDDLSGILGSVPKLIKENLKHIEFKGGKNFSCELCDKILIAKFDGDYNENTTVTQNNFEQHLNSNKHRDELNSYQTIYDDLMGDLPEIFGIIPQYVMNNIDWLTYANESDNYKCCLCEKEIAVVPGSKKAELTTLNFQNHFLSVGHIAKLKHIANLTMEAADKLELIFGKVPNYVLCNIQHIIVDEEGNYECTMCPAKIMKGNSLTTEHKLREHLFGSQHRLENKQYEEEGDEAFNRLDKILWRLPEFILRNIDFLWTYDEDDLFCVLCQETFFVDENDIEKTKNLLRNHMDSQRHQFCLRNM